MNVQSWMNSLQTSRKQQWIIVGIITFVALGLRFYKLGEWSFWGDEYITVRKAIDVFGGGITRRSPSMLSNHVILTTFGVSEFNARVTAAVVGTVSVPVMFVVARKLFDPAVGLISALLLAIAPWHIYWSQNARFYVVLLLFYTVALYFFHRSLEEDSPKLMVYSLIFFGLAAFERLIAGFLVPTILAYLILLYLLRYEKPPGLNWRNLMIYFVPGVLGLIGIALLTPTFQDVERGLRSFGFVNNNPFWIVSGIVFYVGVPLLCVAVFGALTLFLRRDRLGLLLAVTAVTPIASLIIFSLFQYTANRYAFVVLTAVILLAAVAIKEVMVQMSAVNGRLLSLSLLAILIATPMSDNVLYYQFQNGNRDNWKAAFAYINSHIEEGDLVITANRALADYYLGRETLGMQNVEQIGLENVLEETDGRTWVVVDVTAVGKGPTTMRWAQNQARLLNNFDTHISARTFPMEVYLYDPISN